MRPVVSPVVDDKAADRGGPAGEVLRSGQHFDIHPLISAVEEVQRRECRVGDQKDLAPAGDGGQCHDVRDLKLRIRNRLEEEGTGPGVDQGLDRLRMGEIGITRLEAAVAESAFE